MKGRSSRHETKDGMEIDKTSKLKQEPHLSGAYIRSLVKQLTTSRTKSHPDDGFDGQNSAKFGEGFSETPPQTTQQQPQPPPPPPQQHKKQVRRRLHTSRPYQERLLNMAEARREIVTALKFHRASMKHANGQQNQQQQLQQEQQLSHTSQLSSQPSPLEQEPKTKCRRNPRIYPSSTSNNLSGYNLDSFSSFSQHYSPPAAAPAPANPYSWPAPHQTCLPSSLDAINFTLPNQTLGLNLNFQDFNTIDSTSLYRNNNNNPSIYSSSSPSSSSSPTLSVVTEEVPSVALSSHEVRTGAVAADLTESYGGVGLHQAMDDEEMAEIRSLGEQHQMEWDDTVNLVTSAWWFKFLKTVEVGAPEVKAEEEDGYQPFDQVMEFPAWLNANDACLQHHFTDLCPDDYSQDPALPCMEIGEIEGMDGEWLS